MQTNFLKMPTWLDYWLSIIELLINKVMQDPIPQLTTRGAISRAKGTRAEKIEKMAEIKARLRITPENPIPDQAWVHTRPAIRRAK